MADQLPEGQHNISVAYAMTGEDGTQIRVSRYLPSDTPPDVIKRNEEELQRKLGLLRGVFLKNGVV